jgi:hypothetical protein
VSDITDDIGSLVRADPIDFDRLEVVFDEASRDQREAAIEQFDSSIQRRLFAQAQGRSVSLEQIVPADADPLEEVIHQGRNTLPVFQSFQKRFCRPPERHQTDDPSRVWGYNEQTFRAVTGPGYFVAYPDESTGEICVDYRDIPEDRPDDWPEIVPNSSRLGRFVYAGTVDRLRAISDRVTIGRAFVGDDDPMNAWFVLARRDPD